MEINKGLLLFKDMIEERPANDNYSSLSMNNECQRRESEELQVGDINNNKTNLRTEGRDDQYGREDMYSTDVDSIRFIDLPKIGMTFDSLEEVEHTYYAFAGQKGFCVQKGSTRHSKNCLRKKTYVCSKEGTSKAKVPVVENPANISTKPRHIRNSRTGCKALLSIKKVGEQWMICKVNDDHNHEMSALSNKRFLKINREITPYARNLINRLEESNIPPSQQYSYVAMQSGGFSSCSFTQSDFSNYRRDDKENMISHDVDILIKKFQTLKEHDDDYYYSYELDKEGCLKQLFWADPKCIEEYKQYGEAITFDTTYNTNKYKLIIGIFCGVNNHMRTVLFANGFLSNESTESFIWLFSEFKKCMGNYPKTIITDQDAAMKTAISSEFPTTFHRLCKWHITHKMCDKVGTVYRNKDEMERFNKILNTSENINEFEKNWSSWATDNKLTENKWLKDMYTIRESWCPIYMTNHFFGGMQSTQRSEGMNSLVKLNVKRSSTLFEFVCSLEVVLNAQRNKLEELNHRDMDAPPLLITQLQIEKCLLYIYTTEVFLLYQQQVQKSVCYYIRGLPNEPNIHIVVGIYTQIQSAKITCNDLEDTPSCSCHLFSSKAIPCRHIICFLTTTGRTSLPNDLICDRWKKTENKSQTRAEGIQKPVGTALASIFNRCARLIGNNVKIEDEIISKMNGILQEFEALHSTGNRQSVSRSITRFEDKITTMPLIGNPKVAKTKGSGKNTGRPGKADPRFKSTREIKVKRPRCCKKCQQQGHNARSCAVDYHK
ncbi:hypothetical protein ZOSMA_105G00030 [Zostera marina]|uniref:SWIM-type domain-containing protein n=1 Tax=Zostera marina TaxID=29655 RepID=A0A0K9Q4I4_ZOSMR|nr:hypothetical protein ZOSMA_105G00030 [Zostera marina]